MSRSAKQIAFLRASAHGWKPTRLGVKAASMQAGQDPNDVDTDMDEMPVAVKVKALRARGWGKKGGL